MKKTILLSAYLALTFSVSAMAGTESWFSPENAQGGLIVRDRWDSGDDQDAFLIFDAMQTPGQRVGDRIIKSLSSDDRLFNVTCMEDFRWAEAQCRLDLKAGDVTVIDEKAGVLKYRVEGEMAKAWHGAFSASDAPFNWASGDGTAKITSSATLFELTYIQKAQP